MDTIEVPFEEFHACLKELSTINRLTLAHPPTLDFFDRLLPRLPKDRPATVLDIGSGGGDMLRALADWAETRGVALRMTGVDLNPWSAESARRETPERLPIAYETSDIFSFPRERRADVIISSLFTHHLDDEKLLLFVRWMETHATLGWCVNDLHRHWLPYYFIKAAVRIFSSNRFIVHDASVSVARAFTRVDWQRMMEKAGIPAAEVEIGWRFPFRYVLGRMK